VDQPDSVFTTLIRHSRGQLIWGVVAVVLALVGWDLFPTEVITILYVSLFATAALAIWAATRMLSVTHHTWRRTAFDESFELPPTVFRIPEELEHIQRAVSFSRFSAYDAHARLRPLLRDIADAHLTARYGRGLEADTDQVQARLAPHLWEAVRAREGLPDRDAPGVSLPELAEIVSALEDLARP